MNECARIVHSVTCMDKDTLPLCTGSMAAVTEAVCFSVCPGCHPRNQNDSLMDANSG